jgi:hypothetical protein
MFLFEFKDQSFFSDKLDMPPQRQLNIHAVKDFSDVHTMMGTVNTRINTLDPIIIFL